MIWTEDFHIHTKRCKHAKGEPEAYVEQAIRLGLKEMAFTDHIPLPNGFDSAHRMAEHELEFYVNDVFRLQRKYPEIKIRLGIEADFIDGFEPFLEKILQSFPFELVILSIHFIAQWPKGQWVFSYHFPDKTIDDVYSEYLQALKRGIETGLFNVIGHFDLIKRPQKPLLENHAFQIEEIFIAAKERDMAIEINTSGLRKEIGAPYPDYSFLPLIARIGLPITLGSDAHEPGQVGFAFEEVGRKVLDIKGIKKAVF